MALTSRTNNPTVFFNKHNWHARWPRLWIIILGIILILLCLIIVGMEIGHTVVDVYRSTAFGGFILFIPFLICAILIIFVAFKPRHKFLRIAIILCCIMIFLCILLIAYDILVLVDPTRCFFLSCSYAKVYYQANSTFNTTITGWPLYISWPNDFQTNMNAKRIFMGIQLLCAGLFILLCCLFILTYVIYRHIDLNKQQMYERDTRSHVNNEPSPTTNAHTSPQTHYPQRHLVSTYMIVGNDLNKQKKYEPDTRPHVNNEPIRETPPTKYIHTSPQSHYPQRHPVTTYTIVEQPNSSPQYHYAPSSTAAAAPPPPPSPVVPIVIQRSPKKTQKKPWTRSHPGSYERDRVCTRCMKEPSMILTTNYERQNYFSHLCINCNNEIDSQQRKPPILTDSITDNTWKP